MTIFICEECAALHPHPFKTNDKNILMQHLFMQHDITEKPPWVKEQIINQR